MRLTAIIAASDGMDFTILKASEGLENMFGDNLRSHGDSFEVLDVDEVTILQTGRTKLLVDGQQLESSDRVYMISPVSICPIRERKLRNIYHVLYEQGLALLNRSFAANPELEINKIVMQAFVADLGLPTIPSLELNTQVSSTRLLETIESNGFSYPLLLKPNRLSFGVGILKCQDARDLVLKARFIQQLRADYLIQSFVSNAHDFRFYLSRDTLFAHQCRHPGENDFRSNIAAGGHSTQDRPPRALLEACFQIASKCDADYICIDWLSNSQGFVFNEMCSTLGGFTSVPPMQHLKLSETVLNMARNKLIHARSSC